jgi:hypothetical protein
LSDICVCDPIGEHPAAWYRPEAILQVCAKLGASGTRAMQDCARFGALLPVASENGVCECIGEAERVALDRAGQNDDDVHAAHLGENRDRDVAFTREFLDGEAAGDGTGEADGGEGGVLDELLGDGVVGGVFVGDVGEEVGEGVLRGGIGLCV